MVKRLLVLMGMMVLLLMAAVPAFAQDGISGPSKAVDVTGVIRALDVDCNECAHYAITDEATGTDYKLESDPSNPYGGVDLGHYVGLRGTVHGFQFNADSLYVTQIQPADGSSPGPTPGTTATFDFELTVKGEPPAGARFFGVVPAEGCISAPLTDPDGDGVFTGSLDVPRFAPGPVVPTDAKPVSLPVQIVQADGAAHCNPSRVIKDFGTVPANDATFKAKVSFKEDQGGATTPESTTPESTTTPNSGNGSGSANSSGNSGGVGSGSVTGGSGSGSSNSGSGGEARASGVKAKELPKTGGATLPIAGVAGALLVGGGLLIRRLSR